MCAKGIAKCFLIVLNIIFGILGAGCVALGVWVIVDKDSFGGVLARVPLGDEDITSAVDTPSLLENSAYGLLVAGGVMFLIAFLGCCGAFKEVKICLVVYAVIISLILLLEIAAGVLAVLYQDRVKEKLNEFLLDSIKTEYTNGLSVENEQLKLSDDPLEAAWDVAQAGFECCGANNSTDWAQATNWDNDISGTFGNVSYVVPAAVVPLSCCKMVDHDKFPDELSAIEFVDIETCLSAPTAVNANLGGCYESVKDKILEYSTYAMIAGLVIGGIELLGVLAACCLCCKVGKDD